MKLSTKLLVILVILFSVFPIKAQEKPKFGLSFNLLLPDNEFPWKNSIKLSYTAKALYRFDLSEKFMGQVEAGYGQYAGLDFVHDYYKSVFIPVDFKLMYPIFASQNTKPYIYGSVGGMYYDVKYKSLSSLTSKSVDDNGIAGFLEGGLGIQFNTGKHTALDFNVGFGWTSTDNLNYYRDGNAKDAYLSLGAGFLFDLAKSEEPVVEEKPIVPPIPPAPKVEEKKPEPKPEPKVEPKEEVKPVEKPAEKPVIVLESVHFKTNSAKITKTAKGILDKDIETLKANPDVKVSIVGHTDSRGKAKYNMKLSVKRSKSVMKYLVKNGIDKTRLTTSGKGETAPVAPNDTVENLQKNRRAELIIEQ